MDLSIPLPPPQPGRPLGDNAVKPRTKATTLRIVGHPNHFLQSKESDDLALSKIETDEKLFEALSTKFNDAKSLYQPAFFMKLRSCHFSKKATNNLKPKRHVCANEALNAAVNFLPYSSHFSNDTTEFLTALEREVRAVKDEGQVLMLCCNFEVDERKVRVSWILSMLLIVVLCVIFETLGGANRGSTLVT